jgi:hypothetical protein
MQMKGKSRQEVVREILHIYGNVDRLDTICLGVQFKCSPEVITEDVRRAGEALKREALAQERAVRDEQEPSRTLRA